MGTVAGHRQRVLLVDDDARFGSLVVSMLDDDGFEAQWVGSAAAASGVLDDFGPDAAVIDVVMPGRDGLALAEEVRQRRPECHIILFSSVFDERLRGSLRDQGYLYLEKATGYDALVDMLDAFTRSGAPG